MPEIVKARDLNPADTVKVHDGAWGTAVVKQVTETTVKLFRPYGTSFDVLYSGNSVICLVGIEEFEVPRNDAPFTLLYSKELR